MELNGKKIAVTGATGFLGRYIVKELQKAGAHVVAVVRNPDRVPQLKEAGVEFRSADLADRDALARAFQGCDAIVSNAALFNVRNMSWRDHLAANVEGTSNVFHAAAQVGVKRVVHVSSVAVYNNRGAARVIDETAAQRQEVERPAPWAAYSISKAVSEQRAWALASELGLSLTCVRPGPIYGAYDPNLTQLLRGFWSFPLSVVPKGLVLPAVYAGDVAIAIAGALKNEQSVGNSYNTAGDTREFSTFYEAWQQAGGPTPKWKFSLPVPFRLEYDNGRARTELGFNNRPFIDALRETFEVERGNRL